MIIDRYIGRAVFTGTMLALIVFGSLFAFIEFVGELDRVGQNRYGPLQAMLYVALNLPMRLYQIFPTAILLGCLLSLGAMASSSELVVIRAAGFSTLRVTRAAVQAGLLLIVVVVLLGEFIAPYGTEAAKTMRAQMIEGNVLTGVKTGLWSKRGERYVRIGKVLPDLTLQDVYVFEQGEDHGVREMTHAEQVSYRNDQWLLQSVQRSRFTEEGVVTERSTREVWPAIVSPELFDVLDLLPFDMSVTELYRYSSYLDENDLDAAKYWLAFWVKVFTPVTCMGMLLLSIPLVMKSGHRSGGSGYRILVGILIGVSFYVGNRIVNQAGIIHGVPPFLSAGLVPVIVVVAAVAMLRRVR